MKTVILFLSLGTSFLFGCGESDKALGDYKVNRDRREPTCKAGTNCKATPISAQNLYTRIHSQQSASFFESETFLMDWNTVASLGMDLSSDVQASTMADPQVMGVISLYLFSKYQQVIKDEKCALRKECIDGPSEFILDLKMISDRSGPIVVKSVKGFWVPTPGGASLNGVGDLTLFGQKGASTATGMLFTSNMTLLDQGIFKKLSQVQITYSPKNYLGVSAAQYLGFKPF